MRALGLLAAAAITVLSIAPNSDAAISGLTRVASGVSSPIFMTYAPGDTTRLFIAERGGNIRILNMVTGALEPTPFLSMSGISTTGEGGFLGLAFHPGYNNPTSAGYRKFYVNVTTDSTTLTRIREFEVSAGNPNVANAGSLREVLSYSQPQTNHNGGWIGFSPKDEFLYIGSGDGGNSNDTGTGHTAGTGNAQDITSNLLGKILRINPLDPDGPTNPLTYSVPTSNPFVGVSGDDEIFHYGLRNPFRNSFDRLTGDLWIGDVGQGAREEIDFQADGQKGINYGWRPREGKIATSGISGEPCVGCIDPVYDYARPSGNATTDLYRGTVITGGYVYRGPDPSLQGKYFFLDSRNTSGTTDDNYWMFDPASPGTTVTNLNSQLPFNTGTHQFPTSFGEDAFGNLYIAYLVSGEVYRLSTARIAGDYDNDGDVDNADYENSRATLGLASTLAPADGTGNGVVDTADYVIWRKNFGKSLSPGSGSGAAAVPEAATVFYMVPALVLLSANSLFVRRRQRVTMA